MNDCRRGAILGSVLAAVLYASTAAADPVTWSFTGSQGGSMGEGSYGNTRSFISDGVTVTASAWGYTYGSSDSALESAALGRWSTGLGACNRSESCGDPNHQVDNVGADDFVLFTFSEAVDITSIRIDPYGTHDRDVSYWIGSVSTPLNLNGVNYNGLDDRGFGNRIDQTYSTSTSALDVPITGGRVNAILFGARVESSGASDYFKITRLDCGRHAETATASTAFVELHTRTIIADADGRGPGPDAPSEGRFGQTVELESSSTDGAARGFTSSVAPFSLTRRLCPDLTPPENVRHRTFIHRGEDELWMSRTVRQKTALLVTNRLRHL